METSFLVSHDERGRGQVKKRKEGNKAVDVMHDQPGFELSPKSIIKSISLLDATVRFLSRYFGSIFAKSLLPSSGIFSEFFQFEFALCQVFMKLIRQAGKYDEDPKQKQIYSKSKEKYGL